MIARGPLRFLRFPRSLIAAGALAACGGGGDPASTGGAIGIDAGASGSDASAGSLPDGGSDARDGAPATSDSGPDGGAAPCKRGVATNAAPSPAFARTATQPGIVWWYDWSNQVPAATPAIEFVPMIWGSGSLSGPIPSTSQFLLGFNEPNFKSQSDLTPAQAAADWPAIEALASSKGLPIVSPAVNFCGSPSNASNCADPAVTDPYTYLKDFFAACPNCRVDAIAVHWYNCDLPSLQAYIDGSSNLQGFAQFGKPIWLTEFACDNSHSVADQRAYMQAAVPYLEGNPHVQRYSWFSAGPIPNALLANTDGSLTDLGKTYVALPSACR